MSLYNELGLESAMDDGTSKYMLDGNEFFLEINSSYLANVIFFIHLLSGDLLIDHFKFVSFNGSIKIAHFGVINEMKTHVCRVEYYKIRQGVSISHV